MTTGGPLTVSDIRCSDCSLFVVPRDLMVNDRSAYDHQAFESQVSTGSPITWATNSPRPATLLVGFSIGNGSDAEQAVINSVELLLESFDDVPGDLTLGCVAPQGAGIVEAIRFQIAVDLQSVGVAQDVSLKQSPDQATVFEPTAIQPYIGEIDLPRPGLYTLLLQADYDTSEGESFTARSDSLEILVVPESAALETLAPEGMSWVPCPPDAG